MDIALDELPIPDWGLLCPVCRYPLRGLPTHRCPECGTKLDIPALIRPWTRLRPPRFTGDELPFPDFGLTCAACGAPLAGAPDHTCPDCGEPFDAQALRPRREWFIIDASLCGSLPVAGVQSVLAAEAVPHVPVDEKSVGEIIGGHGALHDRLRAPSEFYFEVLWLLQKARKEVERVRGAGGRPDWRCSHCGEENPGHFEVCWNCERIHGSELADRE
jgi:predicted RNA-binding Zn-ribbon protein involved in translation (DUF1610 family)